MTKGKIKLIGIETGGEAGCGWSEQEQSENAIESASISYLEELIEDDKEQVKILKIQIAQYEAQISHFESEITNKKFWRETNDL